MAGFRRLVIVAGLLLIPVVGAAQGGPSTGRIVGRVIETETGMPLSGARVVVAGTALGATTRVDGLFVLADVPSGPITLRVAMIGYAPKTITGVQVPSGGVVTQDVTLAPQATVLEEVVVKAEVEQGSVNAALATQRQAFAIVNSISAEQIKRSPDPDAATALQRMSGATIQDGKYLNMRGLGDRYTQASLNGARIPSPEPERKVVPLDLFPSALLSEITTSKTFTPDQSGDFSGGAVNIETRDFTGRKFMALSVSTGFNTEVTGKAIAYAPGTGRDWIALGAAARARPSTFEGVDLSQNLPQAEANSLIGSFRDVWDAKVRKGSPSGSGGLSLGGTLPTGGNGISYLLSGSYSYTQEVRAEEQRAFAKPPSTEGGPVTEIDRYDGTTGRISVLWGGIGNLSTTLGDRTKISLNTTYNRTMDNEGRLETGYSENLALPLNIQRLRYVERNVYSSQLSLNQEISRQHFLDLAVTLSGVARREPDRSEIVYENSTGTPSWYGFANQAAVRTFGQLTEHAIEASANWRARLGNSGNRFLHFGGLYRHGSRDATNRGYSISLIRAISPEEQSLDPETLFDGRLTEGSDPNLHVILLGAGGSYTARENLAAGYGMFTYELSPSLEVVGGARVEHSAVEVSSLSSAGEGSLAQPVYTDVLPSLAFNFKAGQNINLRLSGTQTLSRPEYRELSPILFREVINGDNVKGNANLKRALIRNLDLRAEWYPRSGEVFSVALFAKWFHQPIERIYDGTSGERIITYINAKGARNYGVELEARRSLDFLAENLITFSVFANATFMHSRIDIDPTEGSVTNAERKMVGQAPYVLNGGITWKHPNADASATVLFNRVGERITEAGEIPLPDIVEKPRNMLDASVTFPLFATLGARLDGKNLLNARYLQTQGPAVREGYLSGRVFSIGFSWQQ